MIKVSLLIAAGLMCAGTAFAAQGNNTPGGEHYNLNLLGKDHCSPSDLTGSSRHTIQVKLNFTDQDGGYWEEQDGVMVWVPLYAVDLDRRNKIFLVPGAPGEFEVLDGNACDREGAQFSLPENLAFEVYVRTGGKPGGSGDITTCGISTGVDGIEGNADDEVVCSINHVLLSRETGQKKFENVTSLMTTIDIDTDGDGDADDSVTLFESDFYSYFWDFDNNGLRLVQLRFYPLAAE